MKRSEIRKALLSERGTIADIARALGVAPNLVSQVLKGRATSKRVYDACANRAAELLAQTEDGAAA